MRETIFEAYIMQPRALAAPCPRRLLKSGRWNLSRLQRGLWPSSTTPARVWNARRTAGLTSRHLSIDPPPPPMTLALLR